MRIFVIGEEFNCSYVMIVITERRIYVLLDEIIFRQICDDFHILRYDHWQLMSVTNECIDIIIIRGQCVSSWNARLAVARALYIRPVLTQPDRIDCFFRHMQKARRCEATSRKVFVPEEKSMSAYLIKPSCAYYILVVVFLLWNSSWNIGVTIISSRYFLCRVIEILYFGIWR